MKKTMSLVLVLMLALALLLCGCSADKGAADDGKEPAYRIAYFVKDGSLNVWRYVMMGAKAEAEKLGVEVTEFAADHVTNAAMQINQIEDAINAGYDALCVIAIDGPAALPVLEKAAAAGLPVVLANGRVDDFKEQVSFVGVDNYEGSMIVTEALYKELQAQGKSNILVITNPPAAWVTTERIKPVHELAEQYGINILAEQSANGHREEAMSVVENLLQTGDKVDAIWCMNDSMAMGAYQAVLNAGLQDEILITGFDATEETVQAVANGTIFCTVNQGMVEQGSYAVRAAVAALNGEEVEKSINTGGELITKDNAQEFFDSYYGNMQ